MTLLRIAALTLAAVLAVAVTAVGADPAVPALAHGDAYVSPRALGAAAAAAEQVLATAGAELNEGGQLAKLAVVAGPVGAPNMRTYTRRLRRALSYSGTLVVTAPGRAVTVEGPLARGTVTRRLREARVGSIRNPTERVVAAARAAVPPPVEGSPGGSRQIILLIGMAVLGGAWAVAWGIRRESRTRRQAVGDARAVMQVCLDAVRARALALSEREPLPPDARARVEAALAAYADGSTRLRGAVEVQRVDGALLDVRSALGHLHAAGEMIGVSQSAEDPFDGLCAVDPAHGAVEGFAAVADGPDPLPVCSACKRAADDGQPRSRRLVPAGRTAIPFSEADLRFPAIPTPGGRGLGNSPPHPDAELRG